MVFNDALRVREQAYQAGLPYIADAQLMRRVVTEAKKTDERAWLGEVSAVVLQEAVADLNADTRRDWHHKLSTKIIRENQAVYVEDLAVSGLARGHLAKSVHDAGWSASVRMLAYKATKHGRLLLRIDRFEPTTRTCSECGWYGPKLELSVRIYHCARCGIVLDRDVNAVRNILAAGRKLAAEIRREAESPNACGDLVRPSGEAQVDEAGSTPDAA